MEGPIQTRNNQYTRAQSIMCCISVRLKGISAVEFMKITLYLSLNTCMKSSVQFSIERLNNKQIGKRFSGFSIQIEPGFTLGGFIKYISYIHLFNVNKSNVRSLQQFIYWVALVLLKLLMSIISLHALMPQKQLQPLLFEDIHLHTVFNVWEYLVVDHVDHTYSVQLRT